MDMHKTSPPPSARTLYGVPTKISRADRNRLIESLGIDVNDLIEIAFSHEAITATVLARNVEGNLYADGNDVAMHRISIPVED